MGEWGNLATKCVPSLSRLQRFDRFKSSTLPFPRLLVPNPPFLYSLSPPIFKTPTFYARL